MKDSIADDLYIKRSKVRPIKYVSLRSRLYKFHLFVSHMPGGLEDGQWVLFASSVFALFKSVTPECGVLAGDFNSGGSQLFDMAFHSSSFATIDDDWHAHDHVVGFQGAKVHNRHVSDTFPYISDHPIIISDITI